MRPELLYDIKRVIMYYTREAGEVYAGRSLYSAAGHWPLAMLMQ